MTIAAGLAITSFNACSQDEDLEGYVLNEENGVSTLAKRSMGRGGESTGPVTPSRKNKEQEVTFHITQNNNGRYDGLNVIVGYSFVWKDHIPSEVEFEYYYETADYFYIDKVSITKGTYEGHYILTCEGKDYYFDEKYIGTADIYLTES